MFSVPTRESSVDEVCQWLASLGYPQSIQDSFRANDIDGLILLTELQESVLKDDLGISSFGIRRRLWRVIQEVQKELQQQEQVAVVDEVPVSAPALSDLQEQQPVVSQHNLSEKDLKSSVQTSHQSPIRAVATTNNISNSGSPSSSSTQLVAAKLLAINQLQPQILSKRKPIYEPVLYPRSGVSLKRPRPPPSIRKRPIHATVEVLSGKTQLSPSPNPRLIRDTDVYFFNNNNSSVFSKQQSSSSSSSSEIVPNTTSRIDNGCLIRESNNGQDFSFIRLQPTSSFPASPDGNNHFMDSQPLVHKKIQRMLLNNNLTIIKDTPRHFKATWKPPVVNEDVRRVFKVPVRTYTRVGDDEIEEMVTTGDRLGTSPANIKRIDKSRRQVYKCVPSAIRAGDAAVSKQQQNCLHFGHEDLDDSDPILPLYNDSDIDEYESDSEWEQEVEDMEAKAAKRQRKEASSSSKPSSPTVDEGEDDLDALMKHQEQRQQQNGGKRLFNNIIDHSPEKRKILLLSEAEIKQVITLYSEKITTQWRERTLPKLALKAHRIWKKYHLGSTIESMEAELEDLSSRRLFRLHEMLVECNFVSVKSCERMCKALDQTIKWQCELKWMISVCKLDTQPPPVVVSVDGGVTAQPAKQPELKQIELESGIPSLDDGVEDTSSDSDDDEHWSDFIVSDDEEEEWAQVLERARDWTTGRITSPRKQRKVAVEDNNKDILENQPVEDKNIMDDDVLNQDCQDQDDDSANLLDLGASPPPTDSPLQIIPVVKAEKPEDLDKMDLDSPTSRDLSAVVLTGSGTTNDPFMISSSDDEDSGIPLSLRRKASVQPTNSTPSFCSSTIKNRFVLSEDDEDVAVITDDSLVKAVSVASTPITSKKKKTKIFDYFTASLSPPLRISSSVESNSGRLSDKIPRLSSDRALLDMDSELDELLMDIIIREGSWAAYYHSVTEKLSTDRVFASRFPGNERRLLIEFLRYRQDQAKKKNARLSFMLSSVPTSEECVNFQRHRFAPFNKRSSSPSPATELVANNSNQMASSSKKGKGKLKRRSEHASSSDDEDESDSQEEDGVLLSINNSSSSKSRNKRKAIRAIRPEQLSQAKMQQSRKQQEEEIQSRIRQQLAFQPRNTDSKKRNIIINLGHDDNEEDIFISEYLATFLKDHQIEGVRFMWKNLIMIKQHDSGGALRYSGCILAHAMGLGKTLQVVTLIDTLMKQSKLASPVIPEHLKNLRVLVIIPAMLLTNWQHEFEKWIKNVGGSRAWDRLGGISSLKKSDSVDDQLKVARSWAESTHGVLLVGYELLRSLCTSASASRKRAVDEEHAAAVANDCNDAGDASGEDEDVGGGIDPREVWRQLLIEKGPTLVICDEAHKLKNHKSGISNILKTIKTSSRIGLTGSPLQNNLEEYWAMVDWVCPNFLGELVEFRNRYKNPIDNGLLLDSTESDRGIMKTQLYILKKLIDPIVLRCDAQPLKDDLPPKKEFLIECILTDLQLKMYKSLVGIAVKGSTLSHFQQVLRLLNHPSIYVHSSAVVEKKSVAAEKSPAAAENLRQNEDEMQVDLPSLKVNGTDGVEAAPEILSAPPYTTTSSSPIYVPPCSEGGNTYTEEQRIVLENCKDIIDLSNIIYSNKMVLILSIVESCIELDEKVLIFSRSIPTIQYINKLLLSKTSTKPIIITGEVESTSRQDLIDDFNSKQGPSVFLISINAGGVGVNLPAATRVIIVEFGWNPTQDDQAIARAYRYGQTKPTFVYRLFAHKTFESRLVAANIHKTNLFAKVIDDQNHSKTVSKGDLKNYFILPADVAQSQLPADFVTSDTLLDGCVQKNRHLIFDIKTHEQIFEDVGDDMTEQEKIASENAFQLEKDRRTRGLPHPKRSNLSSLVVGISGDANSVGDACASSSSSSPSSSSATAGASSPPFLNPQLQIEDIIRKRAANILKASEIITSFPRQSIESLESLLKHALEFVAPFVQFSVMQEKLRDLNEKLGQNDKISNEDRLKAQISFLLLIQEQSCTAARQQQRQQQQQQELQKQQQKQPPQHSLSLKRSNSLDHIIHPSNINSNRPLPPPAQPSQVVRPSSASVPVILETSASAAAASNTSFRPSSYSSILPSSTTPKAPHEEKAAIRLTQATIDDVKGSVLKSIVQSYFKLKAAEGGVGGGNYTVSHYKKKTHVSLNYRGLTFRGNSVLIRTAKRICTIKFIEAMTAQGETFFREAIQYSYCDMLFELCRATNRALPVYSSAPNNVSVDVFGLTFHSQQPPTASLKSANNYIARNAFDYLELNLGLDELVHLKDYHLSLHSTTPLKRVVIDDAYFRDKRRDGVVFPSSRTLAAGLSVSAAATTITTPVVSPAVNTPPRLPPALVPPPPQAAASASVPKINSVASASIKGKAPLVFSSDDEDAGNGRTKGSITGNIGPGSQSSEEDDDDIPLFRGKIHASSFRLPE